jgi:hypothetical protein
MAALGAMLGCYEYDDKPYNGIQCRKLVLEFGDIYLSKGPEVSECRNKVRSVY